MFHIFKGCEEICPFFRFGFRFGTFRMTQGLLLSKAYVYYVSGSGKKSFFGTPSQDQRADTFDDSAPFSSDKIRAKILDLGYGGARRALHNLSPKSLLGFYRC